MKRLMDRVARALGLVPAEPRRRNFVRPEQRPCRVGLEFRDDSAATYDSGDHPELQRLALPGLPAHVRRTGGRLSPSIE